MPEIVVWIMVILVSLVVGFLCGWLLEYYLDLKYWEVRARKRGLLPTAEEETADSTLAQLSKAEIRTYERIIAMLQEYLGSYEAELHALRRDMSRQKARYDELERQPEQQMPTQADDLTVIPGIVRLYQWKLRDAGITSLEQLANTTPEQLRDILQMSAWRDIDLETWIEQARVLTQQGR
jgi:predicted flap endonuclease-1-like 5' DNA nuclease